MFAGVAQVMAIDTNDDDESDEIRLPEHLAPLLHGVSPEITESEKHKIAKLLHKYQSCFVGEDGVLGKTNLV